MKELYKEQLLAKEEMLASTTNYLLTIQRELVEKNKTISEINAGIFESIKFARLIQTALLPDAKLLKLYLKNAAYKVIQQIDIGGDAVFIKNNGQGIVFGLLDATGHGIPATMLSIGGILMLNELTATMDTDKPSVLVQQLNHQINNAFNIGQSIAHMEGTVCFFSSKFKTLSYCSAKGKIYHISTGGAVTQLRNSKSSIGENTASKFEDFKLEYVSGDKIFLCSDGLTDQFGGENDKKFSTARLKKLLEHNHNAGADELQLIVEAEYNNWKKNTPQTDDVSFMILEL